MVGYRALDVPDTVHRGLPSSTLTFIVSLDDGVEAADTAEALPAARPHPVILGGLHLQASHVRQRRGQAGIQVALHPLAARSVFGVPAAELSVTDFDALPMLGRGAQQLHERVADTRHWSQAFALLADYLTTGSRGRPSAVRPEVAYAWHLLERSRGRASVTAIAQRVGLSQRHLTTLFNREVGRTPKTVALLMRFEYATARMADAARRRRRVDLAGIAGDAGYADQAHLTREFVRFAGVPPGIWLSEEFRNIQDGGHPVRSEWCHDNFESDCLVDTASA
ncbi:AraC family transcriptional regulator [Mycolicibacter terrae]|uniref:AraC family transcriptional regulator n=2 Tax=Mycolicibacter TaxID=1073531 RepID=A0A1A2XYC6_MYCSD|nr:MULTISPECIES: helix-turn-helix domain-containing protein [Mycolicibacter]OBH15267.1 AraC family transcriptional regulator [Mycolicibacter sinensis]OBI30759.1 AraC family transcriptional regulator [Mycolicibacter sinensis]RRR42502.1 AraC family transcriptional regulator [Mycolicibacter terrae]